MFQNEEKGRDETVKSNLTSPVWGFGFERYLNDVATCRNKKSNDDDECGQQYLQTKVSRGHYTFDTRAMAEHLVKSHRFNVHYYKKNKKNRFRMDSLKPPANNYVAIPTNAMNNKAVQNRYVNDRSPCLFCKAVIYRRKMSKHYSG